jgi:nucleotide-binding universal stress UspA family protein
MKVLMGADESEFSRDLVRAVVKQFRSDTTEVLVLHVLQQVGPAIPEMDVGYAPEMKEERLRAHALVDRIASELCGAGFKTDTAVEVGDAKEGIIDAGTKWGADLIVVGSHGQRGIRRFLLGSAAEFVARHSSCSVEIVRRPKSL